MFDVSAQQPKQVILMETMPVPAVLEHSRWFQQSLQEIGKQQEIQIELTLLEANGDRELAETLLTAELSKDLPDLVATVATLATQTAVQLLQGTEVPLLFFQVSDPVGAGIVEQLHVPTDTNVTGKVYMVSREAKIEMLLRLLRQTDVQPPIRFGFIHSSYPSAQGDIQELQEVAATRNDVEFVPYEIQYKEVPAGLQEMFEDVKAAITSLEGKVDFWVEPSGPLGETSEYTQLLLDYSDIPVVSGTKLDAVKIGALMHITPNLKASGEEAAELAMQILNGLDPGQVPVTPPATFDVGLNLTTALRLKIVVPPDILQMAGEHVYR
jgi:putative ABC transport system substrate-binding protein